MAPPHVLFTVGYAGTFAIVGTGMHLLVGDAGLVSLGHAGFQAIGAYATVLSMAVVPFPVALLLGIAIAAASGALLGLPAVRLDGPYLALVTLAMGLAVTQAIGASEGLGGHVGLRVSEAGLGPIAVAGDAGVYWMILAGATASAWGVRNASTGPFGRAVRAVRDCPRAAESVGIDPSRVKTVAFAFSAALAGLSGGLLAPLVGYVSPGSFTFTLSLLYFAMVVFGGLGSLSGALLGSLLVGYGFANLDVIAGLPAVGPVLHALSERYLSVAGLPYVGWVLLGAVILCATVVTSGGLAAIWRPARTSRD